MYEEKGMVEDADNEFQKQVDIWFAYYMAYDDNERHASQCFDYYNFRTIGEISAANIEWLNYFHNAGISQEEIEKDILK